MGDPLSSRQARVALTWSFADRYASLIVNMASSMVIARLLTPTEIGLFSVAVASLILATTVRDLGAGNYLIQERELSVERVRATWTVQLGVGLLLAIVAVAISYPAATFYGNDRLTSLIQIIALNYLFNPFGSLTYSWLMREMKYESVAKMRLASAFAGAAVSITLAWHGYGALGLAWGNLAAIVTNGLVSIRYRPDWFPIRPGFSEIARVLSFGSKMTSSSIMSSIGNAGPDFIIGRVLGLAAAGYYSRANGLVQLVYRLFMDALYPVALSMFSQQARQSKEFSFQFTKALQYVTAVCWTLFLAIALLAYPLIHLLFGTQWDASVSTVRWLAMAAAFGVHIPLCTAALVATGNVKEMLPLTAVSAILVLAAVLIGSRFGMDYLGPALALASMIYGLHWLIVLRQSIGFAWRELAIKLLPGLAIAALSNLGTVIVVVYFTLTPAQIFWPVFSSACLGALGFIVTTSCFRHPISEELDILWRHAARIMRQRRDGS